jgi:hypothetical protein
VTNTATEMISDGISRASSDPLLYPSPDLGICFSTSGIRLGVSPPLIKDSFGWWPGKVVGDVTIVCFLRSGCYFFIFFYIGFCYLFFYILN